MKPIDDSSPVPPPGPVKDANYLTQDIHSALQRAVLRRVELRAAADDVGRREAAMRVLRELLE